MFRARWLVGALTLALAGYLALDTVDAVPGYLTSDLSIRASSTPSPPASPAASSPGGGGGAPTESADPVPQPVLAAVRATAPLPTTRGVSAVLTPLLRNPALGTSVGVDVRDARTGEALFASKNARAQTPASLTKIVTAAAVTTAVQNPTQTFTTRVVRGATAQDLVLVASGDNLLAADRGVPGAITARAGLGDLAAGVVAKLGPDKGTRRAPLRIVLDDSMARGPALAPAWIGTDVAAGITGPVAMLGLATDRAVPGRAATPDPALTAANTLRAQLAARGVTISAKVRRGTAPAGASALGEVRSAPILDVLALALDDSDNDLTESVARWACANAGVELTFASCAAWVRSRAVQLGVDPAGVQLIDTSGLSAGTTISASAVTDLLVRASNGSDPALARVLARLPVAGLSGTLTGRFSQRTSSGGAGLVRAKTGTLTGVSSLAGTVVDADGRLLVFTVIADKVPAQGTHAARVALDTLATALAGCGCRG